MKLSNTSKRVNNEIVGLVVDNKLGPNSSDQPVKINNPKNNQQTEPKNTGAPLSYSHVNESKK